MKKLRVCWISAGISSFMAGVLAGNIDKWIYIDIADQHEDSIRFIRDCEKALGINIEMIKSNEYNSVEECILTAGVIKLTNGFAPCTNWLKKRVRKEWEDAHRGYDITYIWGYDCNENARAERMVESNSHAKHEFPLIDKNLSKADVHDLFIRNFNFNRPLLYDSGYPNNNCVGCIKGGMGYWNRIRKDFPEVFAKRAAMERKTGYSILKEPDGSPLFLDELDENRGNFETEIFPDCSIMCYML